MRDCPYSRLVEVEYFSMVLLQSRYTITDRLHGPGRNGAWR